MSNQATVFGPWFCRTRPIRVAGALLIAMMMVGCAESPPPHHANARPSNGGLEAERAGCRQAAKRHAERQFDADSYARDLSAGSLGSDTARGMLSRKDARDFERRLYENCLRNAGVPSDPQKQ